MCLFTQILYACEHPCYILKTPCPTNSPSCVLITNPTSCLPVTCIVETIAYPRYSCGVEGCGYTLASDPFLDDDEEVRPFPRPVVGGEVGKVQEDVQMGDGVGEVKVAEFYRKSAGLGGRKGGKVLGSLLKSVKGAGVRKMRGGKQRGGKKVDGKARA